MQHHDDVKNYTPSRPLREGKLLLQALDRKLVLCTFDLPLSERLDVLDVLCGVSQLHAQCIALIHNGLKHHDS